MDRMDGIDGIDGERVTLVMSISLILLIQFILSKSLWLRPKAVLCLYSFRHLNASRSLCDRLPGCAALLEPCVELAVCVEVELETVDPPPPDPIRTFTSRRTAELLLLGARRTGAGRGTTRRTTRGGTTGR